ncbi:Ham1-like protein,putative [Plasmodium gaboni]|nr:Ham1-like protein,putative [Plasmodium gaboni]
MQKALGSKGIADVVSRLDDNKCHAICTYSVYDGNEVHSFKGITNGKIVEPRGDNKFGWDNIFEPEGLCKTFGEMTFDEKHSFSPRFKAFIQLREFLMNELKKYTNEL